MKLVNHSKELFVYAGVFSGSLPLTEKQRVAATSSASNIPPGGVHLELPPGVYWVMLNTINIGPIPAGTLVAQTGGVRDTDTVVLTEDLRIVVQA